MPLIAAVRTIAIGPLVLLPLVGLGFLVAVVLLRSPHGRGFLAGAAAMLLFGFLGIFFLRTVRTEGEVRRLEEARAEEARREETFQVAHVHMARRRQPLPAQTRDRVAAGMRADSALRPRPISSRYLPEAPARARSRGYGEDRPTASVRPRQVTERTMTTSSEDSETLRIDRARTSSHRSADSVRTELVHGGTSSTGESPGPSEATPQAVTTGETIPSGPQATEIGAWPGSRWTPTDPSARVGRRSHWTQELRLTPESDRARWDEESVLAFEPVSPPTPAWVASSGGSARIRVQLARELEAEFWEPGPDGSLVAYSGPEPSEEDAREAAKAGLLGKVADLAIVQLVHEQDAFRREPMAEARPLAIRRARELSTVLIDKHHVESTERPYGTVWRAAARGRVDMARLRELSAAVGRDIREGWLRRQVTRRQAIWTVSASILLAFVTFLVYCLVNSSTKGFFAWPLRLVVAVALLALGAGVIHVFVRLGFA